MVSVRTLNNAGPYLGSLLKGHRSLSLNQLTKGSDFYILKLRCVKTRKINKNKPLFSVAFFPALESWHISRQGQGFFY